MAKQRIYNKKVVFSFSRVAGDMVYGKRRIRREKEYPLLHLK
jgi:hypothetical protein